MLGGEYSTGYELEFDWRPIDLAGHAHYLDILTIALRSSGMPRSQHSYEAEEGILVKLDSQGGKVTMSRASGGEEIEALATTSIMEVPIRADEWHHVRIRDDGVTIAVYVRGPAIDASEPEAPVLIADVDGSGIGSRVAIYNREHLADVPHESHIDNVTIRTIVAR